MKIVHLKSLLELDNSVSQPGVILYIIQFKRFENSRMESSSKLLVLIIVMYIMQKKSEPYFHPYFAQGQNLGFSVGTGNLQRCCSVSNPLFSCIF
jgi:hypothetical protein